MKRIGEAEHAREVLGRPLAVRRRGVHVARRVRIRGGSGTRGAVFITTGILDDERGDCVFRVYLVALNARFHRRNAIGVAQNLTRPIHVAEPS